MRDEPRQTYKSLALFIETEIHNYYRNIYSDQINTLYATKPLHKIPRILREKLHPNDKYLIKNLFLDYFEIAVVLHNSATILQFLK